MQAHILGVHFGAEAVRDSLLCAGRNLNVELLCGQVAQNLGIGRGILHQRASNDGNANGLGLVVSDGEDGLGGVPIDELHAEDLGLRERGRDFDIVVGRLGLVYDFFDLVDLEQPLVIMQAVDVMHRAMA
jgi:hypothetical protein